MRSDAEVREQIEKLIPSTQAEEISQDRETARNLVHTLTWFLDDPPGVTTPPSELLGYVTMKFTPEALIAFRPEPVEN
jgi:hypothetical protein